MGISIGSLERRVLERLRAELTETLAAHLAYPPFFNYRSGQATCRPLDRAKRDELEQFVRSAHFASIESADITSPDVRRFIEQLLLRYIEVNPALARPQTVRRLPLMRTRVPRLAAETQKRRHSVGDGSLNPGQPAPLPLARVRDVSTTRVSSKLCWCAAAKPPLRHARAVLCRPRRRGGHRPPRQRRRGLLYPALRRPSRSPRWRPCRVGRHSPDWSLARRPRSSGEPAVAT